MRIDSAERRGSRFGTTGLGSHPDQRQDPTIGVRRAVPRRSVRPVERV